MLPENSTQWLEEELDELRYNLKELQRHPAWKFSGKRNYDSLKAKLHKDILRDIEPLIADIEHLKSSHKYFEAASKAAKPRGPNHKKALHKAPRKPRKTARSAGSSFSTRQAFLSKRKSRRNKSNARLSLFVSI